MNHFDEIRAEAERIDAEIYDNMRRLRSAQQALDLLGAAVLAIVFLALVYAFIVGMAAAA